VEGKDMAKDEKKANRKRRGIFFKLFWIVVLIAIVMVGGHYGIRYLVRHILYETTNDAFVDGHIVSLSPKVSGQITRVLVDDNQQVKKGDLLVTIDPCDYQAKVNAYQAALQVARAEAQKAKASISAAKAQARNASMDLKRYEDLKGTSSISKQDLDRAQAAAATTQAELQVAVKQAAAADAHIVQAQADLRQANLELSYTQIYCPRDGQVAKKHAEKGSFVAVGQPLMAIIPYEVWVTANFRETQLKSIHPGRKTSISVDAFPNEKFSGQVNSIQAGTGSKFSLLPPENATGNYVKVVQRVPVKITFDEPMEHLKRLALGMSVEPDVYVGNEQLENSWWMRLLKFLGGVEPGPGSHSAKRSQNGEPADGEGKK
jgi:membrane fusion protein (multidrug efflux system)